jgi:hypothetical protein
MGMGLPISRSLIELHNGRLWPQNSHVPGTTFCFTLPVPDHCLPEPYRGNGRPTQGERVSTGVASYLLTQDRYE